MLYSKAKLFKWRVTHHCPCGVLYMNARMQNLTKANDFSACSDQKLIKNQIHHDSWACLSVLTDVTQCDVTASLVLNLRIAHFALQVSSQSTAPTMLHETSGLTLHTVFCFYKDNDSVIVENKDSIFLPSK